MAEFNHNPDLEHRLSTKEIIKLIRGEKDCVDQIISTSRVHAVDGKGDTALHICAAQGRLQFCDRLVRAGANPNLLNYNGQQPHERARENGHELVAVQLESISIIGAPDQINPDETEVPANIASADEPLRGPAKNSPVSLKIESDRQAGLDWEFEGDEEATDFHNSKLIEDYYEESFLFDGHVERLGDDDGAEFDFDDATLTRIGIKGDGIAEVSVPTAQNAETSTFHSFLDGQRTRGAKPQAPSTRHFAIEKANIDRWVDALLQKGRCDEEMIDGLISFVRGQFCYDDLFANVSAEMAALGLMHDVEENAHVNACRFSKDWIDESDITDLLQSILSGSNIKPGIEAFALSRSGEERLFNQISDCSWKICSTIVEHELLLSATLTLGEQIISGEIQSETVTDLDIHLLRLSEDSETLTTALASLKEYHGRLSAGDVSGKDRKVAEDAVAAIKLSEFGIELICEGLKSSPIIEIEVAKETLEQQMARRQSLFEAVCISQLTHLRRVAARFTVDELEQDDLFQDGYFGLVKSVKKFHAGRGNRVFTYAQYGIRQAIARAIDDSKSVIRIPVHFAVKIRQLNAFDVDRLAEINRHEYLLALANVFKADLNEVHKIESTPRFPIEFDEVFHGDLADGSDPLGGVLDEQRKEVIKSLLQNLPERQADIIIRRFGLDQDDEMTLEQIGQIYGVTRERIRQLEAKALRWLRHPIRTNILIELL